MTGIKVMYFSYLSAAYLDTTPAEIGGDIVRRQRTADRASRIRHRSAPLLAATRRSTPRRATTRRAAEPEAARQAGVIHQGFAGEYHE